MPARIWKIESYPSRVVANELAEQFMKDGKIFEDLGFRFIADIYPRETWTEVIFSIEV